MSSHQGQSQKKKKMMTLTSSVHDLVIDAMVDKLRQEGKLASNTHRRIHTKVYGKRIPDIMVETPPELYEVEVLCKEPLPKQDGTKRILLIATSLDWDEILITSNSAFIEASEIELSLQSTASEQYWELERKIQERRQQLSALETKLHRTEVRLEYAKEEYQTLHFPVIRLTKWDLYLFDCLRKAGANYDLVDALKLK